MSLSPEREQEIRDSCVSPYVSVRQLTVDVDDLLTSLDALRQEHDRLKEENVKLKQKVWGLEQAVEIVRARSFEQQIEDLERQVKIAVEALEWYRDYGHPFTSTQALREINRLEGPVSDRFTAPTTVHLSGYADCHLRDHERIKELEAELAAASRQLWDKDDALTKLHRRISELEGALGAAPHNDRCASYTDEPCDCWKAKVLSAVIGADGPAWS